MYRCNDFSKWYSETTGTPLYDIKLKSKWQSYLGCMEQGMPIKKIAKELNISIQTSFDWRHKILNLLEQFVPEQLSGTVECDELELALSNKGERKPRKRGSYHQRNSTEKEVTTVQVVTAVSRIGGKYLKAVESNRLTKDQIAKVLDSKLADGVVLTTDKHPSNKAYAKAKPTLNPDYSP